VETAGAIANAAVDVAKGAVGLPNAAAGVAKGAVGVANAAGAIANAAGVVAKGAGGIPTAAGVGLGQTPPSPRDRDRSPRNPVVRTGCSDCSRCAQCQNFRARDRRSWSQIAGGTLKIRSKNRGCNPRGEVGSLAVPGLRHRCHSPRAALPRHSFLPFGAPPNLAELNCIGFRPLRHTSTQVRVDVSGSCPTGGTDSETAPTPPSQRSRWTHCVLLARHFRAEYGLYLRLQRRQLLTQRGRVVTQRVGAIADQRHVRRSRSCHRHLVQLAGLQQLRR